MTTEATIMDPSREVQIMETTDQSEQFPGLDEALVDQYVPEHLRQQLSGMMDLYRNYNDKLPSEYARSEADFKFLEAFYLGFIADRARRSAEIATPEYEATVEKANSLLPMSVFEVLCMDGRVKLVHTNGFTAGIGSAIRTPAGMLNEFIRRDGTLVLDKNSNFSKQLFNKLDRYDNVAEVFDSHWTCAARIGEEAATGSHPDDKGLLRDVITKKEMIQATKKMLAKNPDAIRNKNIAFIQTTFNPFTGFMYMGLERDESIEFAKNLKRQKADESGDDPREEEKYAEFTKEVLADLIGGGDIISTGALIEEDVVKSAFDSAAFDVDWQHDYVNSAEKYWNAIEQLKGDLLGHLEEKVVSLYPDLGNDDDASKKEREERAMLLLTNAFNGYLHNNSHSETEYLQMDDHEYEEKTVYPYGTHMEQGVKVSEGGHPPYDIMMFVVYNKDLENLPGWVELASGIVRNNRSRSSKPVKDPTRPNRTPDQVERLPVPIIVQEIIRNEEKVKISDESWQNFESIVWDDLPKDWDTMGQDDFTDYLVSKGIGDVLLRKGIERTRRTMARLYEPQTKTAPHLKELFKTAIPIICDEDRVTHGIIPFAKVGRENGNGNGQIF